MEHRLKRLSRETVCAGRALTYMHDQVRLPDGKLETWDFVHHNKGGGASVLPVFPDGRILLIRQYRPAIDRVTLEIPAGARDPGDEDTAVTALRELREETGYTCAKLIKMVTLDTAVAWCDECTDIYLAEGIRRDGEQDLDEAEEIETECLRLEDLTRMIRMGEIRDAKTVAGILAYAAMKAEQRNSDMAG